MWGRFTKSDCSWESVLQEPLRADVCKTWVSAVAFLVSSHSWTTDSVRSVSTGLLLSVQSYVLWWKKFLHFLWKSGSQSLEEERRGTESTLLEVQCKVSTVSDGLGVPFNLLVLVHCVFWGPRSTQPYTRKFLEHFMLPAADHLYGDADFIFQQDLAPAHSAKLPVPGLRIMVSLFLIGPANSPDLTPIENLWVIVTRKMRYAQTQQCRRAEGHYQSNLGSHNTWAVPQTDRLHATPHCCSNSGKRSPN